MAKDLIDIVLATIVTALFFFILVIVYFLIYIFDEEGSPIFKQVRVGKNKKEFVCYKFRTMRVDSEEVPTHIANKDSITRIGKILRKTKLDELPQLFNVLKGEMSFVGPRPNLPSQKVLIEAREMNGVYELKPGITGLAQINDVDMSNPRGLAQIDRLYKENYSICFDLKLLFYTAMGRGMGDKVRKSTS